ncbi:putative dual-specificity RNA methyltransferase RlmN [Tetrabaena socialis]|uniref:Putative dual-specificity RNA methyltransferase RlmN n=1 Tax=Tetrabaena socialis TaxID=47790 RepID=A0A2J8AD81_9CHLO|nr:putative dual-specificity RNA methyltransferase RlmN [Tetrabaena socialis]|eukprot:PNH10475.1 putative dual-specificity RNA methyltransferase RlmN [Tetrabaena socialis]
MLSAWAGCIARRLGRCRAVQGGRRFLGAVVPSCAHAPPLLPPTLPRRPPQAAALPSVPSSDPFGDDDFFNIKKGKPALPPGADPNDPFAASEAAPVAAAAKLESWTSFDAAAKAAGTGALVVKCQTSSDNTTTKLLVELQDGMQVEAVVMTYESPSRDPQLLAAAAAGPDGDPRLPVEYRDDEEEGEEEEGEGEQQQQHTHKQQRRRGGHQHQRRQRQREAAQGLQDNQQQQDQEEGAEAGGSSGAGEAGQEACCGGGCGGAARGGGDEGAAAPAASASAEALEDDEPPSAYASACGSSSPSFSDRGGGGGGSGAAAAAAAARLRKRSTLCVSSQASSSQRVFYEYVMLSGVNDGQQQAHELGQLLQGDDVVVNLIPWNPIYQPEGPFFNAPVGGSVAAFQSVLRNTYGLHTTVRQEMGQDISGACGQLVIEANGGGGGGGCSREATRDIEDAVRKVGLGPVA